MRRVTTNPYVVGSIFAVLLPLFVVVRGDGDARRDSAPNLRSPAYCFSTNEGVWQASLCATRDRTTADPAVRRFWGDPVCWWNAAPDDFQAISGIGARSAASLARFRDVGGQPDAQSLRTLHGVGERTAEMIAAAVTRDCAYSHSGQ